jgi:GTP cyclohydrolase I
MAPFEVHSALSRVERKGNGHSHDDEPRPRATRAEAQAAVRTLLDYIGDDPEREGLADTPERVVRAYDELFAGYSQDPNEVLARTFQETDGYDEMIVLNGVEFVSHCEHHMVPILGKAYIGYLPSHRVVGISKLARVMEIYAKRLQIQERLTAQVANSIEQVLEPRGVAVVLRSQHQCMAMRGVKQSNAEMVTSRMLGAFRSDRATRQEFEAMAGLHRA